MNVGIATSFTIGGMLLISLIFVLMNLNIHSSETTVHLMTEYRQETLTDIIQHDFSRIGFGFPDATTNVNIRFISDERIMFNADVFDEGVKTIEWKLTNDNVLHTVNPNDKILLRTGSMGSDTPDNFEMEFYVVDFKLTGYSDLYGEDEATLTEDVRSILVEIEYESEIPSNLRNNGMDEYQRKYWRELFIPKNLQL